MTPQDAIPGDLNVEKALLSCCLIAPETEITEALRLVSPSDFYGEAEGLLFDLIISRQENNLPVDPVSITSYCYDKGIIPAQFPPSFISECVTASPNPSHTKFYAEQVLDFSKRRQMGRIASELAAAVATGSRDEGWRESAANALRKADSVLSGNDDGLIHIKELCSSLLDTVEAGLTVNLDPPVATGITALDKLMEGGIRREYGLIGGLQGHGKSLLAMQIAGNLAKAGRRGFVVGYDMTPLQVIMRDVAREAQLPLSQIMGRAPLEGHGSEQKLTRGISQLAGWDVFYTKSPYVTLDAAAAYARSLHRQKPLDWMVVDFLQAVPYAKEKGARTDEMLVGLSKKLDKLQKELGCTLIAPVQLNDDGLIREARGLLDAPQFFFRIEMEESANADGEMEAGDNGFIRILKNRFGVKRRCPVFRNGPYQRFEDREYTPPPKQQPNRRRI